MTEGDAEVEAKRRPYGDGKLAHPRLGGIGQGSYREPTCFDLNHRNIRLRIHTPDFCLVGSAILEANRYRLGIFNHVPIGKDVPVFPYDHARTLSKDLLVPRSLELFVKFLPKPRRFGVRA